VVRRRTKIDPSSEPSTDIYGLRQKVRTFSTGCTLLDCALGGGWALNRISNIIGDTSTGKTLMAIEACANYAREVPKGKIEYREAEAAFDEHYAGTLGLPLDRVSFEPESGKPVFSIEDVFEDLENILARKVAVPTFYVIDSLDALSDRAEQGRSMDEGTYGTKSKMISEWFRRQNSKLSRGQITLMVISQVRDAIGVKFGEKHKRSGGRALDFYATHALWLAHLGMIKRQRDNVERVVGVRIRARCKKNKIAPPFRECEVPILFGYGIEDVRAGIDWLVSVKKTDGIGLDEAGAKSLAVKLDRLSAEDYAETKAVVSEAVLKVWASVEDSFRPGRSKYA